MPGPSRSCCLLRSSRTETIRVAAGSRAGVAAVSSAGLGGGAAVAQAQAISSKKQERLRAFYRRGRPAPPSFPVLHLFSRPPTNTFSPLFRSPHKNRPPHRLFSPGWVSLAHGRAPE